MRRLRFRVGLRGLAALVALVALGLFGWRVYREGLGEHWMLLKLRLGGVLARRDALDEIRRAEGRIFLRPRSLRNPVSTATPARMKPPW